MGTDTPFSFFASDVATWLRLRGYDIGSAGCGLGEGGLGSVRIGRLRWGRQGPAARHLVQDGSLEVRVDRHGSHVGNPFAGAPVHQLCKAYDELLRAVLVAPLSVDDGLREFEALRHDTTFGLSLLSSFERPCCSKLLRNMGLRFIDNVCDHLQCEIGLCTMPCWSRRASPSRCIVGVHTATLRCRHGHATPSPLWGAFFGWR